MLCSAPSVPQVVFTITEKAPTRAYSWLKAPTSAFTFKTLLRHYAKQALTPRSLNVKLGPRRNYHKGRAAITMLTFANLRIKDYRIKIKYLTFKSFVNYV